MQEPQGYALILLIPPSRLVFGGQPYLAVIFPQSEHSNDAEHKSQGKTYASQCFVQPHVAKAHHQ